MDSRIISVSYGHGTRNGSGKYSASGKLYDYETSKNYHVGDVVVVPVEHAKSHKLYNTLAVVRMTANEDTEKWKQKADNLTDPNNKIKPKNVGQRVEVAKQNGQNIQNESQVTVRTLPGYSARKSNEKWSEGSSRLISRGE